MSWKCPHCGFEAELAPLTFKNCGGQATCPICARALPQVAIEDSLDKSLEWIEREDPALFDHLIEKIERRAARRRILRWIGVLTASASLALLAYLLVRHLL